MSSEFATNLRQGEKKMGTSTFSVDWLDGVSEDLDLRKKRENSLTDRLVHRANWLEASDRELILSMFRDGHSANTIALLVDECPRFVRRRIKRLVNRLNDPRVAYVVEHHQNWSKTRRAIAQSLFIQGRSMRETTHDLGVSFYSVRKHRETIDAMCQASMNSSPVRAWRS